MTLRDHCTAIELQAHAVLDTLRAGFWVPPWRVTWALSILGEPVGQ